MMTTPRDSLSMPPKELSHSASEITLRSKTALPIEDSQTENEKSSIDAEPLAPVAGDFNPSFRFVMVFVTLSVITLAAALDATSISVALPIMADNLKGTAIEAFWAGTSFLLTSTVFQPVFASMSHIFGRKLALYVALVFFAVGAILAAVANDFTLLLVGRVLQGIGGGGIFPISEILVTDLVPLRERGKWFAFLSSMWALGSVSGPIIGGAFAQKVTWRWIFWINLPLIGIAAVLMTIFLTLNLESTSLGAKLKRFDWLGAFIFIASTTSFLIPVTWGGVSFPWNSWHTLVPLFLGVLGEVLFVVYEIYFASHPMVPLSIFRKSTMVFAYLATFTHGMILWCLLYYLPLYFEAVKHYSPILTGVALFPETFTVVPASIAVGVLCSITGHYRWAIWLGWFLTILGTGLLYLMSDTISVVGWVMINIVTGLGTGVLFPAIGFSVQAASDPKDTAFAVAFYGFFRSFGQGIGVAVGGVVFQNSIRKEILSHPIIAQFADQYSADATSLVGIINSMAEGEMRTALVVAYADALKLVWIVTCAFAVVGGIASIFIKGYSLDQTLETSQGFREEKAAKSDEEVAGKVMA